jgi:glucan phosphoethanolaminetransferase (alkaline phosphatase superfamily)
MPLQQFKAKLNWRLVAVHFVATWLFMYAGQTLAVLHNPHLLEILKREGFDHVKEIVERNQASATELTMFSIWPGLGSLAGEMIALGISLTITIRRRWFWFNSLLVPVLIFLLSLFGLLGWHYLKMIFLIPGEIFSSPVMEYLANGLIMLALGLFVFFGRPTNGFIKKGNRINQTV